MYIISMHPASRSTESTTQKFLVSPLFMVHGAGNVNTTDRKLWAVKVFVGSALTFNYCFKVKHNLLLKRPYIFLLLASVVSDT